MEVNKNRFLSITACYRYNYSGTHFLKILEKFAKINIIDFDNIIIFGDFNLRFVKEVNYLVN